MGQMLSRSWAQGKTYINLVLGNAIYLDDTDYYSVYVNLNAFTLELIVYKDSGADQTDFETNYKDAITNTLSTSLVTSQFELNDKALKIARGKVTLDGVEHTGVGYILVPGTFGAANEGRYISGGWGMTDEHDPDDYVKIYAEDKDRLISTYGFSGATDEWMQANTPYTAYPIVGSYTDDEQPSEDNKGWYLWPTAQGNSLPPVGEVEFEPIGGYAFTPAGMYIKIIFVRPNKVTGYLRFDLYWGQHQSV